MLFNSWDFAVFLPLVFLLYWFIARDRLLLQNMLLLVASYFFYACWDYRFLSLLLFSSLVNYGAGISIAQAGSPRSRKFWLWFAVGINLGLLAVFKYFDFFIASFADSLALLGFKTNPGTLELLLPIGISFYTFHGLSYVIDLYNNRIKPERNIISYALFTSFFPLLVAGPIERATHLLPQLSRKRIFNYTQAVDGLRQILWGLFKKIVIADNCAPYVNLIFDNADSHSGSTLVLGVFLFAFQIYCDFSGYSDIAIGTARLFGIDLLRNFAFPYFSRDIPEFWHRWHISLSSWFRDYVYIPLGGSRAGKWQTIRNVFIVFVVSGFWHGANWTFVIWGFLHACYMLPSLIFKKGSSHSGIVAQDRLLPTLKELCLMLLTFVLVLFAWIFFRAQSIAAAFDYIAGIFERSLFTIPDIRPVTVLILLMLFVLAEWMGRRQQYAIQAVGHAVPVAIRWAIYYLIVYCIVVYGGSQQPFIYFDF